MIPTERDRLELRHLIDNAELKRRLLLADAVIEAVRAAGPFPLCRDEAFMEGDWYVECLHCGANNATDGGKIIHADDCTGVALRAALDALDAGLEG
jgi:hypothetical protein